uniref:Mitochondrial import inner membrane translocase subunit TIM22 n=1 Tax=Leersia perrieri TaxID=77586 RepID=A0A0D9VVA0_9ORYZ
MDDASSSSPSLPAEPWNPYPSFIINDAGFGFLTGGSVGAAYHTAKGLATSPRGHRLAGAARAVRANVPRVSSTWGARCGLYGFFRCAISLPRARDNDPVVSVAAAAAAVGVHSLRRGPLAAGRGALAAGATMAVVETFKTLIAMVDAMPPDEPEEASSYVVEPQVGFLGFPPKPIVIEEVWVPEVQPRRET